MPAEDKACAHRLGKSAGFSGDDYGIHAENVLISYDNIDPDYPFKAYL
ncbi:MAG: hypothetical protein JW832_10620 [Deltaproteobacteria bacterium]|nr:hypothetical protein [Deltaproteobacteria bacterium]